MELGDYWDVTNQARSARQAPSAGHFLDASPSAAAHRDYWSAGPEAANGLMVEVAETSVEHPDAEHGTNMGNGFIGD